MQRVEVYGPQLNSLLIGKYTNTQVVYPKIHADKIRMNLYLLLLLNLSSIHHEDLVRGGMK